FVCSCSDAHFDRPAVASVLRTESDRVPHVLVSQASTDLRRTRSESQLVAKALDSISISSSVSGGMEDEVISVYTLSSLGSEPTNDQLMTLSIMMAPSHPSVLTPRAKDDTLTPGMTMASVEKEVAAAGLLPTTLGGQMVALQASKRKVLDLMQKRRPVTPSTGVDNVEMGADAGDLEVSTATEWKAESSVEMQVVDKKEKRKKGKKNRSPTTRQTQPGQSLQDSPTSSLGFAKSKTTKSVHFRENVLWGQSLIMNVDGRHRHHARSMAKT
ncbi:hypothetical protein OSTOST_23672, partial [Ostertagia ostertagi]